MYSAEFGASLKEKLTKFGDWSMGIMAFGEILPYDDNRVHLNEEVKDKWGLPTLHIDAELKENEKAMRKNMQEEAVAMLEASGCTNVSGYEDSYAMGEGIHEMGTARMGDDPKEAVLNRWNQVHDMKNVFVTDGACMTSAACQNPSLTYMALTARATDYAVKTLNQGGFKS
jgi:choline dehydrogenase-like flavoprotein